MASRTASPDDCPKLAVEHGPASRNGLPWLQIALQNRPERYAERGPRQNCTIDGGSRHKRRGSFSKVDTDDTIVAWSPN